MFNAVSETQMRWWRWLLLLGWFALIASLLIPSLTLPAALTPACAPEALAAGCGLHRQPGNRLFWGVAVPMGLLLIGVISHELWRRICPLAFVSQLGRALGWQRTRTGKGGRREVVKVEATSWLGRHHIALQWSLLIAGLCLRLLWVNSSPVGLALLLLVTLLAAVLVGWAYGGKAWCQYVCPMGPVQTVLTGLRGPLGSTAHWGASSRITQSMCRTVAADGREQSACVACQTPCLDIDAERAFWQTSRGKRSLTWVWLSYPGLVLAFFGLMDASTEGYDLLTNHLGYLRSGAWAFDEGLSQRALLPLEGGPAVPRLIWIPVMLSAAASLSVVLFRALELGMIRLYSSQGYSEPADRALLHTRLLATFLAINSFFWFVDPLQGAFGVHGGQLLRSLVLCLTAIALFRSWSRDQATYRRESVSQSLRGQLKDLPGLEAALDGRSLDALSPQEVFTLVKALPAVGRQQARSLYQGVMGEMLRSGRLERASSLLELADLRQSLALQEVDHHAVVRLLAAEQPELLQHDGLQQQRDDLCRAAAGEAIEELMRQASLEVLDLSQTPAPLLQALERLAEKSGLDQDQWRILLQRYGPGGQQDVARLEQRRASWHEEALLAAHLDALSAADPLLKPLHRALVQRTHSMRSELQARLQAAALEPLPDAVVAKGDHQAALARAMDVLWNDPDPDTAGWVLMLARERDPQQAARYLQDPRSAMADSAFLQSQRQGQPDPDRHEFPLIAAADLFADLLPSGVIWVARQGFLRHYQPGEQVMRQGETSDHLALVLSGEMRLQASAGQQVVLGVGQTVGEMGVIMGQPRHNDVVAGPEGAKAFILPTAAFEQLLQRSPQFGRGLLAQLAERLAQG